MKLTINDKEIQTNQQLTHACESDGMNYLSYPPQYKCKICGRFDYIHKNTIKPEIPNYFNY